MSDFGGGGVVFTGKVPADEHRSVSYTNVSLTSSGASDATSPPHASKVADTAFMKIITFVMVVERFQWLLQHGRRRQEALEHLALLLRETISDANGV